MTGRGCRITGEMIANYCDLTDDFNPIHRDEEYAAAGPLGGIIAPGTLALNLVWESLSDRFGSEDELMLDVRFVAPVRIDDVITAGMKEQPAERGTFEIWAKNQDGLTVLAGTASCKPSRTQASASHAAGEHTQEVFDAIRD